MTDQSRHDSDDPMLHFNGVHVDDGSFIREPMPLSALRERIKPLLGDASGRKRALVDWVEPDDLRQTGWGVITHEDEDPAILAKLKPLLEHRRGQAGEVRYFQVREDDLQHGDAAIDAFFDRYGTPPGDVDPEAEQLPYYLMIVGSPQKIPFSFQAELDITHASGRLWFDDMEAFANYAANIVAQEAQPSARCRELAFYGTDNGDKITELICTYLIPPLAEKMDTIAPAAWQTIQAMGDAATKAQLLTWLTDPHGPALLMTAGHGAVSRKRTHALQGALISSQWRGGKLNEDHYVCGADIKPDFDFRGLIPFFFACFSAGTPVFDSFAEPGKKRWRWSDKPFIADLVQALLGHAKGPPAVIAHVDQAFQFSFLWHDQILGIAHFAGFFRHLMQGRRVGYAMEPFRRRFAAALASLKRAKRRRKATEDAALKCWLGYQDARYYAVLGDPAVRLHLR